MADRPPYSTVTALTVGVGALIGLISTGTALLGSPMLFEPGLLSWPGLGLALTLGGFLASAVGLATVAGIAALRAWALKTTGVLGLLVVLAALVAMLVLAPLKGFVFPAGEVTFWSLAAVFGVYLMVWSTWDEVAARFAEEESFPSTSPAGGESAEQ